MGTNYFLCYSFEQIMMITLSVILCVCTKHRRKYKLLLVLIPFLAIFIIQEAKKFHLNIYTFPTNHAIHFKDSTRSEYPFDLHNSILGIEFA